MIFPERVLGRSPAKTTRSGIANFPIFFATDLERRNSFEGLGRAVDSLPYLGDPSMGATYLVNADRRFLLDAVRLHG